MRKVKKPVNPAPDRAATLRWFKGVGLMPDHLVLRFPGDHKTLSVPRFGPRVNPFYDANADHMARHLQSLEAIASSLPREAATARAALMKELPRVSLLTNITNLDTLRVHMKADELRTEKAKRQTAIRTGQHESRETIGGRVEDWHERALEQAEAILKEFKHVDVTRLTMRMCGQPGGKWNPKAPWYWNPQDDPRKTPENDPAPHKKDRTKRWVTADTLRRFLAKHSFPL